MKKLSKFIITIVLSLLFIPHVNAGVPSITVPGNMVYVYYDYNESAGSSVSYSYNTTYFNNGNIYIIKNHVLSNDTRNFIFVKKRKLTSTLDLPTGDWANITLGHAAYYNDDSGNRIYLNINVKLIELKLVPKNGGSCNSNHRYAVFSFVKKVYASARVVSGSELKEVSENNCSANVRAKYRITFTRSDNGASAPSNMAFLWKISDIDQPDKKYNTYDYSRSEVDFVESMNFSSGFDTNFYRADGTYLRRKKDDNGNFTNKFIAHHTSDSSDVDPGNTKTSVWVFQKGPIAEAVWRGSWGVETGLVGNNTGYEPPVCTYSGGKYYGINGSVVGEATFKSQCTCKAINGKYYGFSGLEVNATNFKSQCACRFIGNGQYLDANGNVTNFDGWKTSCTCNKRGDYYYGSSGQIVTFWAQKEQCFEYEYKGDSCNPTNNEVVDNNCEGARITDSTTSGTTKFDGLDLNSDSLKHTSCRSDVYEASNNVYEDSNFYIKEPTMHMDIVSNNNNRITNGCAPVSVSVPLTITENIVLNVSKLKGKRINGDLSGKEYVYAGGGFGWDGSTVENQLAKIWSVYKKEKNENNTDTFDKAFKIKFKYHLGNSVPTTGYFKLSEVPLYTDSNCTNVISYDTLEQAVVSKIKIDDLSLNQRFYASTDVNDVEDVEKSMVDVLSKEPNPEVGGFSSKNNSVSLKNAYIDRKTAKVSYPGTIPTNEMDINSENNNLVNAGQLYYVPLKYTGDEFVIGMSNQNLSVIGQATSFTTICKINVEHIFYENGTDGRLRTVFHYRPIKTNDTFNGQSKEKIAEHAQNWAQWYCDENGNCGDTTNRRRIENTYEIAGCVNSNVGYDANNPGTNADNNKKSCASPLYHITIDASNISKIRGYNGSLYTSFESIKNDGSSKFVSSMFEQNGTPSNFSYCNLGQFNASCDRGSGS